MRDLSAEMQSAVIAPNIIPFVACELDYPSGPVRVTTLDRPVMLPSPILDGDDAEYLGLGVLGEITAVEIGAEDRSYPFGLKLSGIPGDWCAYLRGQDVQGRLVTVAFGTLTPAYEVIGVTVIKRARMDTQDVTVSAEGTTVEVTCESILLEWETARSRWCTSVDHKARHPGDKFFDYTPAFVDMTLRWGK